MASGAVGVQSLDRAFELLERLADAGSPRGLSELAESTGLPLTTIHRIMRSLIAGGYVRQETSRRYGLGPRLIRLGEAAGRTLGSRAVPHLTRVVAEVGETANLAILDGDAVVYLAQVPSPHPMRMFTEVGRRVQPHSTGVGKALLSLLPDEEVRALCRRTGMPAANARTITTADALITELREVRRTGFAVDDGEQEVGVRCVAVPVTLGPAPVSMSVSGPSERLTGERVPEIAPVLQRVAAQLAGALSDHGNGREGSAG